MFSLLFPYILTYVLLVVIGICSYKYYFVSLCFTNWLHLLLLLKSLPKLQPEPSLNVIIVVANYIDLSILDEISNIFTLGSNYIIWQYLKLVSANNS